jgi:hypothetical protein
MAARSRRSFICDSATAVAAASFSHASDASLLVASQLHASETSHATPSATLIGIQIAGHSLLDEGMDRCLDTVQSTCQANALFLYSHSYYAAHGRSPALYADHGLPIRDERQRRITRVWLRHHVEAFKGTSLGVPEPTDEYGDRDLFADTVEACKKRGLKFYARILEPSFKELAGRVANAERTMSVGIDGQISGQPCRNHPEWIAWWDALVSDTMKSYPLDGFQWGAERMGPLSSLLWKGAVPFCFCQHCKTRAKREGIHVNRARQGFTELHTLIVKLHKGGEAPADGVFTNVLRVLMKFPEVLAWDYQWRAALEEQGQRTYTLVKDARPTAQVGRHFDHQNTSWDAIFLAQRSYAEVALYSDFIKPILYHDILAPRLANQLQELKRGPLAGISLQQSLELYYAMRGYDASLQPKLDELPSRGMDPEYVGVETRRIVEVVKGQCAVVPGIGVDVPNTAPEAPNDGKRPSDQAALRSAITKAFEAGASGILISREYDEMRLESLRTIGETLTAL